MAAQHPTTDHDLADRLEHVGSPVTPAATAALARLLLAIVRREAAERDEGQAREEGSDAA